MRGSPVVRRGRLERADLGVLYDPTRVVGRLTRRPILRCECGHGSDHAGVDEVPCARVDQGRMSRASIAQPLQGAAAACLSAASGNCPQAANPGCPLADTSSLSVVVGCETTRIQTTFGAPDRCRWSGVRRWSGQGLVLLPASREGSSRMPLRAYPQGQSRHGNPAQFIPHGRGRGADRAGVTHPMLRMCGLLKSVPRRVTWSSQWLARGRRCRRRRTQRQCFLQRNAPRLRVSRSAAKVLQS